MSFNNKGRSVVVLAILTLLINTVWAAPEYPDGWTNTRLMIRGAAETWDDAGITSNYGMGAVGLGVGLVQPIWGPVALDIEFTYKRLREGGKNLSAEEYSGRYLQIIPVSALIEIRAPISSMPIEVFVGTGPAIVAYAENQQRAEYMEAVEKYNEQPGLNLPNQPASDSAVIGTVIHGARPSVEARAGIRIDPGFIHQPMAPAQGGALTAVEIEIYGARRFTSTTSGFNLNTWRLCLGMGLRF